MSGGIRAGTNDSALQQSGSDAVVFNSGGVTSKVQSVSASVAASALTVELNPCVLDFRSATLTDGVPVTRTINSALSLTVPSGATLGCVDTIESRLILLAIDNAGTVELAIVNQAGGTNLDETGVISTTAIDATADSDDVIYSTTARTDVAYRVVGFVESTQATAGTWATSPTVLQGAGGNALTAMNSLGYGQTWQVVTGSRSMSTTYYNTTGKPIIAVVSFTVRSSNGCSITVDGIQVDGHTETNASPDVVTLIAIIPPGSSYSAATADTYNSWTELR